MKSAHIFVIIGRSGCGKGTQAKLLIDLLKEKDPSRDTLYVEMGVQGRTFMEGPSHSQKVVKDILTKGGIFPEFLATYFWAHRILSDYKEGDYIIIDGTPRKYLEAAVLGGLAGFYGLPKTHLLYLDVSKDWSKTHLMNRRRFDDNTEDINARLAWFESDTMPAIEYCEKSSQFDFHKIEGERPVNEVHADVRAIVNKL